MRPLYQEALDELASTAAFKDVAANSVSRPALISLFGEIIAALVTPDKRDSDRHLVVQLVRPGEESVAKAAGLQLFATLNGTTAVASLAGAFTGHLAAWGKAPDSKRLSYAALVAAGVNADLLEGFDPDSATHTSLHGLILGRVRRRRMYQYAKSDYLRVRAEHGFAMKGHGASWKEVTLTERDVQLDLIGLGLDPKEARALLGDLRVVDQRQMVPGVLEEVVTLANETVLNTYTPGSIKPSPGNFSDIESLVLNLAGGSAEGRDFILDWLASMIQGLHLHQRAVKHRTALVLVGDQGTGKDTLRRILMAILGDHNVKMLGQKALQSRFGDPYKDKLLVVFNEIEAKENDTHLLLKLLVTEEVFSLEPKGKAERTYPNFMNVMVFSNEDVPVRVEETDRRYSVFRATKLDKELATRIYADLEGRRAGVAAFMEHLLSRAIRNQPGMIFDTEHRDDLGYAALTSEKKFLLEMAELGLEPLKADWLRTLGPFSEGPETTVNIDGATWFLAGGFYAIYQNWCDRHGYQRRGENALAQATHQAVPTAIKQRVKLKDGSYRMAWRGLPLQPAAEACADETGGFWNAVANPIWPPSEPDDIEEHFWQRASRARN